MVSLLDWHASRPEFNPSTTYTGWTWRHNPVMPILRRQREEYQKPKVISDHIVTLRLA